MYKRLMEEDIELIRYHKDQSLWIATYFSNVTGGIEQADFDPFFNRTSCIIKVNEKEIGVGVYDEEKGFDRYFRIGYNEEPDMACHKISKYVKFLIQKVEYLRIEKKKMEIIEICLINNLNDYDFNTGIWKDKYVFNINIGKMSIHSINPHRIKTKLFDIETFGLTRIYDPKTRVTQHIVEPEFDDLVDDIRQQFQFWEMNKFNYLYNSNKLIKTRNGWYEVTAITENLALVKN